MAEESGHQLGQAFQALQVSSELLDQITGVEDTRFGIDGLDVAPDLLFWIEMGRLGWQVKQPQMPVLRRNQGLDAAYLVGGYGRPQRETA